MLVVPHLERSLTTQYCVLLVVYPCIVCVGCLHLFSWTCLYTGVRVSATVCLAIVATCVWMCMCVCACVCCTAKYPCVLYVSFSEALQVCVFRNVSLVRLCVFLWFVCMCVLHVCVLSADVHMWCACLCLCVSMYLGPFLVCFALWCVSAQVCLSSPAQPFPGS